MDKASSVNRSPHTQQKPLLSPFEGRSDGPLVGRQIGAGTSPGARLRAFMHRILSTFRARNGATPLVEREASIGKPLPNSETRAAQKKTDKQVGQLMKVLKKRDGNAPGADRALRNRLADLRQTMKPLTTKDSEKEVFCKAARDQLFAKDKATNAYKTSDAQLRELQSLVETTDENRPLLGPEDPLLHLLGQEIEARLDPTSAAYYELCGVHKPDSNEAALFPATPNPDLSRLLRAQLTKEHSTENLDAIDALEAALNNKNPAPGALVSSATEFKARFVGREAESQINISAVLEAKFTGMASTDENSVREVLIEVRSELQNLVSRDSGPRFLAALPNLMKEAP